MLTSLAVATAVIRRLPPLYVGLLALAIWLPWIGAAALGVIAIAERPRHLADSEVAFLAALAAHLNAGQALRHAIVAAAEAVPMLDLRRATRSARAGLPIEDCAAELTRSLPTQGTHVGPALVLASRTGGRSAAVFEMLTARAASELDLRRELRSGIAAARFSVLLLAGGPLALVLLQANAASSTGVGGVVRIAGTALALSGALTSWAMVKRATR